MAGTPNLRTAVLEGSPHFLIEDLYGSGSAAALDD